MNIDNKTIGYINQKDINFNEFQTILYFSGFTFKYIKTEDLEYNGEDSIIYINYDMNRETHEIDMINIHSNIKNIYTNEHTLIKIRDYIPENIENIYTGDLTIEEYQNNKYKYYCFITTNDNEILDKLRQMNEKEIEQVLKIRNRFKDDIMMKLVINRCHKSLEYMIEYIERKGIEEKKEIYNRRDKNNKTLIIKMIENGFMEEFNRIYQYIEDETINILDDRNNNIISELLYKNQKKMIEKILREREINKKILMNGEDLYYGDCVYNICYMMNETDSEYKVIIDLINKIICK